MVLCRYLPLAVLLTASLSSLGALETDQIDPRSTALVGCGVACVDDGSAWFHNPGALGFLGPVFSSSDEEGDVQEGDDDLSWDVRLAAGGQGQLRGQSGSSYTGLATATAGATVRVGPFVTGCRTFATVGASGLHHDEFWRGHIDATNRWRKQLYNLMVTQAWQSGDFSQVNANPLVLLEDRRSDTVIVPNAFAVAEVPLSFGHSFFDLVGVGVTLKCLYGRVYGGRFFMDDAVFLTGLPLTSDTLYADPWIDDPDFWVGRYRSTWRVGVDAGVQVRWLGFTLGVAGRNLNGPSFRGLDRWGYNLVFDSLTRLPLAVAVTRFPAGGVTLDPQLAGGLGYEWDHGWGTLTLTAEGEALRTETILPGQYDQYIRAGAEWALGGWLALRAGVGRNVASPAATTEYGGGLAIGGGGFRFELGGTVSRTTFGFDNKKIPWTSSLTIGLSYRR